jgi:hypothetical protein
VNPGIPSQFVLRRAMLLTNGKIEFVARASGHGPGTRSGEVQLLSGDRVVDFEITTFLFGSRATIRR